MVIKSKYIGALAILLGLFSCVQEEKKIIRPFIDVLNFNEVTASLDSNIRVSKTVYHTDKIESIDSKTTNWEIELKPFIDADFNRPANKDNYTRTETISLLTGWRDVTWVSIDPKLPVKWAVYRFKDSTCIGAVLSVNITSKAYQLNEILTYIPNRGYSIDNTQDLAYISGEEFYLSAQFTESPQDWRAFFAIGEQNIPVNFDLISIDNQFQITFHQGKERIVATAIKTDSGYVAEMPIFQSYIHFQIDDDTIIGDFHNLDRGPKYIVPFTGIKLPIDQLLSYNPTQSLPDFSGKWETYFDEGDGKKSIAIGLFDRLGNDLFGTFATETGDYRFLQGKVTGDSFSLSTFDGSHLYLFTGTINGDEISNGHFYSGNHYHTTWSATRNNDIKLQNPEEMTSVIDSDEPINFTFPDLNNNPVSLTDDQFENKVVIVQILGSWCPNCMDETRYFIELYEKYHHQGLEIIGLAFERSPEFDKAKSSLEKSLNDLHVPYPVLIAGTPNKSAEALPMITKIKSYPTSIFIDKNGKVAKIHTGFYGPSTGSYYTNYTKETEELIEFLLK